MSDTYEQLMQIARRLVMEAKDSGAKLSAKRLAGPMMAEIDPDSEAGEYLGYCARASCVQFLGKVLRRTWGTVDRPLAEDLSGQMEIAEFTSCLQDYYPVAESGSSDDETEYRPIDDLTTDQIDALVEKMRRVGDHWHKHADQLSRYHRSKTARLLSA
jgi:hypothetical protein